MSKFLELVESNDPKGSPKWDLVDFLKSKGINVSVVKNTDMLYIDTGSTTIAITVSNADEDAEGINAGYGNVDVMDRIGKMADEYDSKGKLGKIVNPTLRKAKKIKTDIDKMNPEFVQAGQKAVNRLRQDLNQIKRNSTASGSNINY